MYIDKKSVLSYLKVANKLTGKNSLSVLGHHKVTLLKDRVMFQCTNLRVEAESEIAYQTNTMPFSGVESMEFLAPATVLKEAVKFCGSTIEITVSDGDVLFDGIKVNGDIDVDKFPEIGIFRREDRVSGILDKIPQLIHATEFVSDDETRFFMNGVCLEMIGNSVTAIATDGRAMCQYRNTGTLQDVVIPEDKPLSIIVPSLELLKGTKSEALDFVWSPFDKKIKLVLKEMTLFIRIIEGQFPNYRRVVPDLNGLKNVTINGIVMQELYGHLKKGVLTTGGKYPANFNSRPTLTILFTGAYVECEPLNGDQPLVTVANPIPEIENNKYQLQYIRSIFSEKKQYQTYQLEGTHALRVDAEDETFVVMPMQMD